MLDLTTSAQEETGDTATAASLLRHSILLDPGKLRYNIDFAGLSVNRESFLVGVDIW